jgi:hypothetical protein
VAFDSYATQKSYATLNPAARFVRGASVPYVVLACRTFPTMMMMMMMMMIIIIIIIM